jgi:pSer/pThr/pTyr-binding forkhead associated (FHA) protein
MAQASTRFVVKSGPNPGMVFELTKEVTLIGRDVTNDIALGDSEVSRQHARLTNTPGGIVLEDLGSTNGSFVNGERLMAPRVLNAGDIVGLGENVTLAFESTIQTGISTVMGPSVRSAEATPAIPMPVAQPPPTPIPQITPDKSGGGRKWLLAGVGCLVLIIACVITLFLMDNFVPDILYAPLRWLGFN